MMYNVSANKEKCETNVYKEQNMYEILATGN